MMEFGVEDNPDSGIQARKIIRQAIAESIPDDIMEHQNSGSIMIDLTLYGATIGEMTANL